MKEKILFAAVILMVMFFLGVLISPLINQANKEKSDMVGFEIRKYQDGYEIYKNGKLEFEFTKENTDSLSLETLKWIYEGD